MGKGDKRSKRGKIWRGTSGKTRPRKSNSVKGPATTAPSATKKVVAPKAKPAAAPKAAPASAPKKAAVKKA